MFGFTSWQRQLVVESLNKAFVVCPVICFMDIGVALFLDLVHTKLF